MARNLQAMDGMTAAAYAAYALSDAALIFPITPASHMAETVEKWASDGRENLFGAPVAVKEMQSEKGVSGALHGALAGGALASTFTASQGLMLMVSNLYKISGELLPGVLHVTTRSLAAHALSIFGDHQDLMAVRASGVAMLGSANVQECMDLSLVAHLSAIDGSLPFVHFFDGFRTSDEICTIEPIDQQAMAGLVDWAKVRAFRDQAMDPEHPMIRGTAQNPDVYFQNREAPNRLYDALPGIVQANMDKVAKLTGRAYRLFDYVGHPQAEHVVVTMASSCDCVEATVRYLCSQGQKVGLVKVRLYRPFSAEHLLAALPDSVRAVTALDRTKEPGSLGEPLFQDVCMALAQGRSGVAVYGGRYGLSSKEFDPAQAKAVFDNMASSAPRARFTVGITDDLTHLSLDVGEPLDLVPDGTQQSIFYGFGSDGTVGAAKASARLVSAKAAKHVQQYSWFDSKKSGGLTLCYLRFGNEPIRAPYLIGQADYVGCHKDIYVKRGYSMADHLRPEGAFVLNTAWTDHELAHELPSSLRRALARKRARLFTIDAAKIAAEHDLGPRINMIMQVAFFKVSGVLPFDEAMEGLKEQVRTMYASKGADVVAADIAAIDAAAAALHPVDYPASWADAKEAAPPKATGTAFVDNVFWPCERLEGDRLPTSALNPAGFVPLGTTALEKRTVAVNVPAWDLQKCIQCYQCSFVCPHAAIRPFLATEAEMEGAPASYETKSARLKGAEGLAFRIQVYPQDCVGCGSCADNCPGHALTMRPLATQLDEQKRNLAFAQENVSLKERLHEPDSVPTTQLQQPLLQFSGCCAGCGETPYVKLLTQLFGERLIIANATGCSSIWGAYMPAMPYATKANGHGPAWGNSLFEDNGEYGYGIAKAIRIRRERLERLVRQACQADSSFSAEAQELMGAWLDGMDDPAAAYDLGQAVQANLREHPVEPLSSQILEQGTMFGKKSVWTVGGDGWAYDIDYDGLDEVLASGENVNVLVLDTEGYSNTGGEMSKATQLGSVSGFAMDGKPTPKKNLGTMCMQYGYVYVAQVCLGADMQQVIDALREAESYDGPSIVIALCPCISWGLKEGMSTVVRASKQAVKAGYWPLFRFDPRKAAAGADPLTIDYQRPDGKLADFLARQDRYASLAARKPELSRRLQSELAKDVEADFERLTRTVAVYEPETPTAG